MNGEGFRTLVQPATKAGATFQTGMVSGKFHGVISPTTPIGCRKVIATVRGSSAGVV